MGCQMIHKNVHIHWNANFSPNDKVGGNQIRSPNLPSNEKSSFMKERCFSSSPYLGIKWDKLYLQNMGFLSVHARQQEKNTYADEKSTFGC